MNPPAERIALDLVDAHMEALCDGTGLPGPLGPAVEGGDQLVRWALDRLRRRRGLHPQRPAAHAALRPPRPPPVPCATRCHILSGRTGGQGSPMGAALSG